MQYTFFHLTTLDLACLGGLGISTKSAIRRNRALERTPPPFRYCHSATLSSFVQKEEWAAPWNTCRTRFSFRGLDETWIRSRRVGMMKGWQSIYNRPMRQHREGVGAWRLCLYNAVDESNGDE